MTLTSSDTRAGQIRFTLPYPPSANRYWRMVRDRMLVSREAREYKARIAGLSFDHPSDPIEGDLSVRVRIYRPAKRGDLDNSLKVLLDSIRGIAYADDKQVKRIEATQFDDKKNPRVEMEIESLTTPDGGGMTKGKPHA